MAHDSDQYADCFGQMCNGNKVTSAAPVAIPPQRMPAIDTFLPFGMSPKANAYQVNCLLSQIGAFIARGSQTNIYGFINRSDWLFTYHVSLHVRAIAPRIFYSPTRSFIRWMHLPGRNAPVHIKFENMFLFLRTRSTRCDYRWNACFHFEFSRHKRQWFRWRRWCGCWARATTALKLFRFMRSVSRKE